MRGSGLLPADLRQVGGGRRVGRHAEVERVAPVGHRRLVQVEVAVVLDGSPGLARVEPRLVAALAAAGLVERARRARRGVHRGEGTPCPVTWKNPHSAAARRTASTTAARLPLMSITGTVVVVVAADDGAVASGGS